MSREHEKSRDLEVATTGVCRESEFPPTEELNASAANQVSVCKLCRKRAMMLSNPISLHVL